MTDELTTPGTVVVARPKTKKGSRLYRPMIRVRNSCSRLHPKRVWMDEAGRWYTLAQLDVKEVIFNG
jgi:hypothetical protein